MVRIVQYNVLSSNLASPSYYVNTDPECLHFEYRWKLLNAKLTEEIKKHSILCLQEISMNWLENLTCFFREHDYVYEYNNYGNIFNGYMGVLIAYPRSYKLDAIKMIKIGDVIKEKTVQLKKTKYDKLMMWIWWLLSLIRLVTYNDSPDAWTKSIQRWNILLCLRLTENNKTFCIGTYHMPCAFKDESMMLLHSATCVEQMDKFAGDNKYILAGDFNFKPDSLMYKMITEGGDYTNYVEKSKTLDTTLCKLNIVNPMRSAYKLVEKEPEFTNCAHTINSPPFIGCIDYIFVSDGWKVDSVNKLPAEVPDSYYPSMSEPSDHLMLAAELIMQ